MKNESMNQWKIKSMKDKMNDWKANEWINDKGAGINGWLDEEWMNKSMNKSMILEQEWLINEWSNKWRMNKLTNYSLYRVLIPHTMAKESLGL